MTIGNINTHSYTINNIKLNSLTEFKYLGIIFNTKLTFDTHINQMCSKAFNILNIIFRCFIINDYCYLIKALITYVIPLLEYNSCIWNPSDIYVGLQIKFKKSKGHSLKGFSIDVVYHIQIMKIGYYS